MVRDTSWMEMVEDAADDDELLRVREEVVREAASRRSNDIEGTALRMVDRQRKEAALLKTERAELLAQLDRIEKENADLRGRLAVSAEGGVQNAIDKSIVSLRLSRNDTEKAITVVNHIKQLHALSMDPRKQGGFDLQAIEGKKTLNRTLRCLLFESHAQANQAPLEVLKYVDGCEFEGESNLQVVFIEGEALIFRMTDLQLQPKDILSLCSVDEECPKGTGGWGFKSVYILADELVLISPPFQIRLDGASRGPYGVLYPEWVPSIDAQTPDGEDIIPSSYHNRIKGDTTFVYAPLRESAKSVVKVADMETFEGLSLAFLRNLRRLEFVLVSYEGPAEIKVVRNYLHEVALQDVELEDNAMTEATSGLRKICKVVTHKAIDAEVAVTRSIKIPDRSHEEKHEPVFRYYRIHEFHVAIGDKDTTCMSLAFPLGPDKQPITKEQRTKERGGHHTEMLYCPVSVQFGGRLPFAIKADFDLTNGMLGLHPTSSWNHWVLSCAARLFVLAFLSDNTLRNYVDHYMPDREHAPCSGLWRGTIDVIEKLVETHMFAKTESDLMVPRMQVVVRPATIPSSFIPDTLLRQVTQGRRHFVNTPWREERATTEGSPGDNLPSCPLETLLQCVEKLSEAEDLSDTHLQQLWSFLASELSKVKEEEEEEEEESSQILSPAVRALLLEKLRIWPVQGRKALRRFMEDGVPVFLSIDSSLEAACSGLAVRDLLVPLLDLSRLRGSESMSTDDSSSSDSQLQKVWQALGVVHAEVKDVKATVVIALSKSYPLVTDAGSYWALQTLIVERFNFSSINAFVGPGVTQGVPTLEARGGGGDDLQPKYLKLDTTRSRGRLVMPTFLGVALGQQWRSVLRCVPPGPESSLIIRPPESSQATWGSRVAWEKVVMKELGVDGGSNRRWDGVFKLIKPRALVKALLTGVTGKGVTGEDRSNLSDLLEVYTKTYRDVFERIREAHRGWSSASDLAKLTSTPEYWLSEKGASLRCTRSFLEGCLKLVGRGSPSLSAEELQEALHVYGDGGKEEEEAVVTRLCQETGAVLANLQSCYDVTVAFSLITNHVLQKEGFLFVEDSADAAATTVRVVKEGALGWGNLLTAVFRHALELCVLAAASGGDKRVSSSDVEKCRALLEQYCRDVGVWVRRPSQGSVLCCRDNSAVWSVEGDPIVKYIVTAAAAGGGGALPSVVVLSEEDGYAGSCTNGANSMAAFLSQSLNLEGGAVRRKMQDLLVKGLERWAEHKGPMPRDVEDMYRAIDAAVQAGEEEAGAKGSKALLGLEVVPVVKLDFSTGTVPLLTQTRTSKQGQQVLVAVTGAGDAGDTTVAWFYRQYFPSRCLHPSITALLKASSSSMLARMEMAQPIPIFTETFADATTGSVVSCMKSMNVDMAKVTKMVSEMYAGPHLACTELQRFWANVGELRDAVLQEYWKEGQNDPSLKNQELIDAVKDHIKLPLTPSGGGSTSVELTNCLKRQDVYLGSILGIDLELDKLDPPLAVVKHPWVSRDSNWHKQTRPEDGFNTVEQSCYWERFFLEMGVKPLDESIASKLVNEVLSKVFLALVKFNALLNGPTKDSVASKYSIWHSYHHLYQDLNGNMYLSRHQERRGKTSKAHADGPGLLRSPKTLHDPLQGGLVGPGPHSLGPSGPPPFSVVGMGQPPPPGPGSFDYGGPPPAPFPPGPGGYGMPPPSPFQPGGFGGPPPPHHGHGPGPYFQPPPADGTHAPSPAEAYNAGAGLISGKRPLEGGAEENGSAPKVTKLQPPTPNVNKPAAPEEGEIEEGEIY